VAAATSQILEGDHSALGISVRQAKALGRFYARGTALKDAGAGDNSQAAFHNCLLD
jgi:hypothetical protein